MGRERGTMRETAASFLLRVHSHDRRRRSRSVARAPARGEPFDLEFRVRVESGAFRWFRTRGRSMLGPEGKPERMAGSLADITERKQAEARALRGEGARPGHARVDRRRASSRIDVAGSDRVPQPGRRAADRLGPTRRGGARGHATSSPCATRATGKRARRSRRARAARGGASSSPTATSCCAAATRPPVAIDYSVAPIRNRAGSIVGAVLVFQDMSREREYVSRLSHLASHDALTGLINRREFEHRLQPVLASGRARPSSTRCSISISTVQGRQRHLRPRRRRRAAAAGDRAAAAAAARRRHAGPPRRRRVRRAARALSAEPALRIAEALRSAHRRVPLRVAERARSTVGVSIGLVNVADEGRDAGAACSRPPTPPATWRRRRAATACRCTSPDDREVAAAPRRDGMGQPHPSRARRTTASASTRSPFTTCGDRHRAAA